MLKSLSIVSILYAFLMTPIAARAQDDAPKTHDLEVLDAWVRPTIPGAKVSAGYLTIRNHGERADALLGAEIERVGRIEIHTMSVEDDIMRMERLPAPLVIPMGEDVMLAPGGLHLMLMRLDSALNDGEVLTGALTFEVAGEVPIELQVSMPDNNSMTTMGH